MATELAAEETSVTCDRYKSKSDGCWLLCVEWVRFFVEALSLFAYLSAIYVVKIFNGAFHRFIEMLVCL